jgi:single-stranded DNA-binding protein
MDIRIITGRLGKDSEVKCRDNGSKYLSYSLAVDNRKSNGEKETTWFNCTQNVYGDGGSKLTEHLKKGVQVLLIGRSAVRQGDNGLVHYFNVNEMEILGGGSGAKKENKAKMNDEDDDMF